MKIYIIKMSDRKLKMCRDCKKEKLICYYDSNGTNKKTGRKQYKPMCKQCRKAVNATLYKKRKDRNKNGG